MVSRAKSGAQAAGSGGVSARIVSVGNQKGGVAKSTNTVHIATALGELGKRCLIWDLDMNYGSTRHFGIPAEGFLGTFEVIMGEESAEDVVVTNDEPDIELPKNVHIIPASRKLEKVDEALSSGKNKFLIRQDVLIEPLKRLRGNYDYIFLDTAPNATTPTIAAYKAAHWFLLSAMPDPFAVAGLQDALTDIKNAQEFGNPTLSLLGVVLSGVANRTRLATALVDYIRQTFTLPDGTCLKFKTEIARSTVVPAAQKEGKTLFQTHPRHKVTHQYRALALEIEERFAVLESTKPQTLPQAADEALTPRQTTFQPAGNE